MKAQCFTYPSEDVPRRYHYPLRPHECEQFSKLSESLSSWDPAKPAKEGVSFVPVKVVQYQERA